MKTVKGITALLLCAALLIFSTSFSAFAAESGRVTVKSAQGLFEPLSRSIVKGDTFDVVIKLQSDLKIVDGTVKLGFDSSCLKVTGCSDGNGLKSLSNISEKRQTSDNSVITIFTAGESFYDFTSESTLLTYNFEVNKAPCDDYEISVDFLNLVSNKTIVNSGGNEDITVNGDVRQIFGSVVLSDGFLLGAEFARMMGDVNLDNVVNVNDVTELQLSLVGKKTLADSQKQLSDVYRDGKLDIRDATVIQLFLADFLEYL